MLSVIPVSLNASIYATATPLTTTTKVVQALRRKNPDSWSLKNNNLKVIGYRLSVIENATCFFSEAKRNGVFRFAQNRMHLSIAQTSLALPSVFVVFLFESLNIREDGVWCR